MWAMVHVELHGASTRTRRAFDDAMRRCGWTKLPDPFTTWTTQFGPDVHHDLACDAAEGDVSAAAQLAGVERYDAIFHYGPAAPTKF